MCLGPRHTLQLSFKRGCSGTGSLFMVLCIPLKASQAQLKVGPYSIFMKLALCEIGFCLMDPCMGAPPDTSATAYRHWSHTDDTIPDLLMVKIIINIAKSY